MTTLYRFGLLFTLLLPAFWMFGAAPLFALAMISVSTREKQVFRRS